MGRLDTFVAPQPHFALIKAMTLVNRIFMLKGIVGLRDLPPFNRLAGLRGLANVRCIEFPTADQARLAAAIGQGKATFVTPNHPEFFTDWMIDKEISSRLCPKAAFWATNSVVNGLGKLAQKFWLANNLIAQIPGNSKPAREHSIDWALKGNVVLLHPEGQVGWHSNFVAPLMSGAVEMAREAVQCGRAANAVQEAWVAPVVWKLAFQRNVESELLKECEYVEGKLKIAAPGAQATLPQRIYRIYEALLSRDERKLNLQLIDGAAFQQRQGRVVETASSLLLTLLQLDRQLGEVELLKMARRRAREMAETDPAGAKQAKLLIDMVTLNRRLGSFAFANETVTQEELAEHLKRLRADHCHGTLRDTINRFVPQPAGPRTAYIRVPEPLPIHRFEGSVDEALVELRHRMQETLDSINRGLVAQGRLRLYANPFCPTQAG